MLQGWMVVLTTLLYIGLLFAIASYGDHRARNRTAAQRHPSLLCAFSCRLLHQLDLLRLGRHGKGQRPRLSDHLYRTGYCFYAGLSACLAYHSAFKDRTHSPRLPIFSEPGMARTQQVAAVATIIAVVGTMPYIALQLKAVATSVAILIQHMNIVFPTGSVPVLADIAFFRGSGHGGVCHPIRHAPRRLQPSIRAG